MGLLDSMAGYEHRSGGMYPYPSSGSVQKMPPPKRKSATLRQASAQVYFFQQETAQNNVTIEIESISIFYSCGAGAGTRTIYLAIIRDTGNEIWAIPRIDNASLNGTLVYLSHGIDRISVAAGATSAAYESFSLPDFLLRDAMGIWIVVTAFAGDIATIDINYREVVT